MDWVSDWQVHGSAHAACSLSCVRQCSYAEPRWAMWRLHGGGCITHKSPFNRQSQVTPHLINSRLMHSLLCSALISISESPIGVGLVAGITRHVKWLRHGMSPALHQAFSSLGQSEGIVGEEMYLPQPSCQTDPLPPSLKNDLRNLLSWVRLSHIWQYVNCSLTWGNESERERERNRWREREAGHTCMHAWLKLVCSVNDNRKRCHIERLLG